MTAIKLPYRLVLIFELQFGSKDACFIISKYTYANTVVNKFRCQITEKRDSFKIIEITGIRFSTVTRSMTLVWILLVVALCLTDTSANRELELELEVDIASALRTEYYAYLTRKFNSCLKSSI